MHDSWILVHTRTTLNVDDRLIEEARRVTGINAKTALIRRGLEELIARESARMLAALGGSSPRVRPIPRRRTKSRSAAGRKKSPACWERASVGWTRTTTLCRSWFRIRY
jgi:hypothetical protein